MRFDVGMNGSVGFVVGSYDSTQPLTIDPILTYATYGTLTFAPGETSKSVSVPILDDPTVEPNEALTLILSAPTNATLGTPNPATLTILDNETPQPYDETYTYNKLGNLTSKTGKGSYSYPASGSAHPQAVTSTSDGQSYVYDANGNLTGTGGLLSLYDAENRRTPRPHQRDRGRRLRRRRRTICRSDWMMRRLAPAKPATIYYNPVTSMKHIEEQLCRSRSKSARLR